MIEVLLAAALLGVVTLAITSVLRHSLRAKDAGDDLVEAQQNARVALDTLVDELRGAGYSLTPVKNVPIEVASEYRLTLVADKNGDGAVGAGERITYFLDSQTDGSLASRTANPYDRLIRRVGNSPANPLATPTPGEGDVVAYLVTQRKPGGTGPGLPLFDYVSTWGNSLIGSGFDPAGSQYGRTVAPDSLGLPAGTGKTFRMAGILVNVVTETGQASPGDGTYRQVTLTSKVQPRNFGLVYGSFSTVVDTTG